MVLLFQFIYSFRRAASIIQADINVLLCRWDHGFISSLMPMDIVVVAKFMISFLVSGERFDRSFGLSRRSDLFWIMFLM
ncbi:hypothetical protein ACG90_17320 [Pseudomonas aeruginosa]|nr:hypothetical protein BH597_00510 [Pseudomonas aeruginosa]OXZ15065.1 hypothetical protein ACG90_17320 [Pseudomonas aeruginosa]